MRRSRLHFALPALSAIVLAGCSIDGDCYPVPPYDVRVTVRDSRDGAPIANASVVVVDGAYREMLRWASSSYAGAQRAGTYLLTVSAPGYQPAPERSVVVRIDDCQLRGQAVTIDLVSQ